MIVGKLVWLQEEGLNEDISVALIIWEQFSISVLFRDILEAISLILCYRTMWWLDLEYSLTFTTLDAHSIFILLSTMDWYLEVKNLSRRQTVFFLPVDPIDENHKDPEYTDFYVPRLARYLHSAWKRHQDAVFWVDIDLAIKEGLTFYQTRSNAIILQGTLPAHCFLKIERLETGEVSCMRDNICLLDHHQRSHYDTITIGRKGMINRVLQLNNSQLENSLNILVENNHVLSFPNQPNQNPIQSVIDRGNLRTQNVFLWRKKKRPVHKGSMINVCKKNLALQIEQGTLWNCVKTFASCMLTMEQENLWSQAAQAHTVKEFVPAEHRDVQPCNWRGEYRFQHPRSAEFDSETIAWRQRSQLDSEDRKPPSATCTSKWSSTTSTIQSFQQRITRRD